MFEKQSLGSRLGVAGGDALYGPEGDDGAGNSAGTAAGTGVAGAGTTPPAEAQKSGTTATDPNNAKLLPQEKVNELVGTARVEGHAKGKTEAETALLAKFGVSNVAELEAMVNAAKLKADAEKTAEQRLAEFQAKTAQDVADLQKALAAKTETERELLRVSALKSTKQMSDAHDQRIVLDLIKKTYANEYDALVDNSGVADQAKAQALIDKVRQSSTFLFKREGIGTFSLNDGETSKPNDDALKSASQGMYREIRSRF